MEQFDLIHSRLSGVNLIEASAGTGKTYTIAGLFLRLVIEQGFSVDQILVVTFTRAATDELKGRIRSRLIEAKEAFLRGGSRDGLIGALADGCHDPSVGLERIHDALVDFDRAQIFTIHGFCQRLLQEHAFETAGLFDTELVTDQSRLLQTVADDYWRKSMYTAPVEFVSFCMGQSGSGPGVFLSLLGRLKSPSVRIIPGMNVPSSEGFGFEHLDEFRNLIRRLRSRWRVSRDEVAELLKSPSLNGTVYGGVTPKKGTTDPPKRLATVAAMLEDMDRFADDKHIGFPLFDKFERFTADKLQSSVKKGQPTPDHDLFCLCDEIWKKADLLTAEMREALLMAKRRFIDFAWKELARQKRQSNIVFFDDLLTLVKQALIAGGSSRLISAVRDRYAVALVDEFQDTDPVQYDIFNTFFSAENSTLFMIGDPKQAIYSFRGADIFSYMDAADHAGKQYTLRENWRSHPRLIQAVNTVFSGTRHPFVFSQIGFDPAISGKPEAFETDQLAPDASGAPLTLWYLSSELYAKEGKPVNKTDAEPVIARAVADEICRLIHQPGTARVRAGDIAVLVRTNRQAAMIRDCVAEQNIPSVVTGTENVFDSHEADEMQRILLSLSEPADLDRLRAALAADMLGISGNRIDAVQDDFLWWEQKVADFRAYRNLWAGHGFIRMFRLFMARENVKSRLLGFIDGERRLTNVLHLSEILHQQSVERHLGIKGLLKWLAVQKDPSAARTDAFQLRLERDEFAVKIVTIHKSKGLEYPVVFCPFSWHGSEVTGSDILFHDMDESRQLTCDLGSEDQEIHRKAAQNELLAENLRLLYVALTRARTRCYLVWGRINKAQTSALAYLFHADEKIDPDNIPGAMKTLFSSKTDMDLMVDLKRLAAASDGSIDIQPLPQTACEAHGRIQTVEDRLFCRKFAGHIDTSWKISSFSALVSGMFSGRPALEIELPDRDDSPVVSGSLDSDSGRITDLTDIFSFPKGARAGLFFHDIFEHLDFAAENPDKMTDLVTCKLREYGFESIWADTVCRMVEQVLSVPLAAGRNDFVLSAVRNADRLNEMEFYFPILPVSPRGLSQIFARYGKDPAGDAFAGQIGKLTFSPARGFMKGFMDMVFRFDGRFYLLDWKSNVLGTDIADYDTPRLSIAMSSHGYILQYCLYTLALHQYFQNRIPGFR
ncbi:MAG: exodeoxyribonuclease V subunit beta [Desulfobacterales bacterium]|nr:exodeoxyribonuclease V subunit beta [Desulfobacterales bacterium]